MNNYLVYIDVPPVPEVLLEPIDTIINMPPKPTSNVSTDYTFFQTRLVSAELNEWVQDTFKTNCHTQYQLVREGIDIHRDKGRNVAFNYLLDTGGENALTCVYNDDYHLMFIEHVPERRWHRLKTDVLHNVRGIQTIRVALSVELLDYKWGDPLNI